MNSFSELIKTRRSTRKFTDQLLTEEEVEALLKAALMAPSSKGANAWQFVAVEEKETLHKLSLCKKHSSNFVADCALAIVVLGDATASDVWVEDASIAAIYLQLQAEDLGLGSCWVQVRNRLTANDGEAEEYVRYVLGIPYQLQVLAIIAIGHKGQERKPFDEARLQWEKIHIGAYKDPQTENAE
jgi:nitroreductase